MTRLMRAVALTAYFGLFFLLVAWHGFISPPSAFPRALLLLIVAGPLLFPLRGLIHGRPYTHAWTSFLALFYFALGVFQLAGEPERPWLPMAEVVLGLLLFLATTLFARLRGRELSATVQRPG